MSKIISALTISLLLLGCASQPNKAPPTHPPSLYSDRAGYGYGSSYDSSGNGSHAGQWAVAVIGTPFYLAFKTAVCGASLVVAAPTAAVIALSDSPYAMGVDKLGDGVAANCGPPYVLSPS